MKQPFADVSDSFQIVNEITGTDRRISTVGACRRDLTERLPAAVAGDEKTRCFCIYDIFGNEVSSAVELCVFGKSTVLRHESDRQEYTVYHSLIDEPLPVWKKDIEEMKRLYVADDPGENKHVELTKWAHVYIDYDGEQIWISDKDEENGAFFSRENGKLKLISTVRANLKPSFPESRNGNHYLMLSGSAGGPSYYTEIFKFKGGKVVEKFNAMEIYGEIDECSLNGKTISKEQGKAYMNAVPDATEPYIFWQEIEE